MNRIFKTSTRTHSTNSFCKTYQLQKLHEKVQNFLKKSCSLDDKKFGYDK